MIKKSVGFAVLSTLMANVALAQTVPLAVAAPLPVEEGGMLALAAAGLALGIRMIKRKGKR